MSADIVLCRISPVGIYGRDQHGIHWTTFSHTRHTEHGWRERLDVRCDLCGKAIGRGYVSFTGDAKRHVCTCHVRWDREAA